MPSFCRVNPCNVFLVFLTDLFFSFLSDLVKLAQKGFPLPDDPYFLVVDHTGSSLGRLSDLFQSPLLFHLTLVRLQNLQPIQLFVTFHRLNETIAPPLKIALILKADLDQLVRWVLNLEEVVSTATLASVQFTCAQVDKVARRRVTLRLFVAKDTFFDLCVAYYPMRFALQCHHSLDLLSLNSLILLWTYRTGYGPSW